MRRWQYAKRGLPMVLAASLLVATPGMAADRMVLGEYFTMLS